MCCLTYMLINFVNLPFNSMGFCTLAKSNTIRYSIFWTSESIAQFYNKVLWKYTFLLTSTYISLFFGYIEIFYPWVFIYFFACFCALHSLTRKRAILCGDKVCVFLCCLLYTTITPIGLSNAFDWPIFLVGCILDVFQSFLPWNFFGARLE